jgi:5-methylcytosine-specific restriction enzyme subunit McrC
VKIPIRNLYFLLLYAWDCLDEAGDSFVQSDADVTWVDLAGSLLAGWLRGQRRRGLDQGYADIIETTRAIRGKLLPIPTLRYRHLSRGQAVCLVDQLNSDTNPNRVVKASIHSILASTDLNKIVREELRVELQALSAVTECPLTEHLCHYAQTSSNNQSYQLPISIGRLLARQAFPDETPGPFRFRDFERDDGPMAELFETFVRNFYRREQKLFNTRRTRLKWDVTEVEAPSLSLLPRMQTDVTLESVRVHAIIETKYYAQPLADYHDSEKLRASHLYQLSAYLQNYPSDPTVTVKGILLYAQPTSGPLNVHFKLREHPVRVQTIDLSQEWRQIKASLLETVEWLNSSNLGIQLR